MTLYYIIGGGPSFMDVTEEEWKYLENKHTLTFARIPYGSRKTEYYMSIERNYADKSVLTYMAKQGYLDTKLLLYIPESINLARQLKFKNIRKLFKQTFLFMPSRRPWFVDEKEPPHKFIECRAHNFHQPIFRFRGQLIAAINCAIILGATEIRLIGVDLNNQDNFYNTPYLEKCCKDPETIKEYREYLKENEQKSFKEKKESMPTFNPESTHTTNVPYIEKERWGDRPIRGVSDVLQWIDKEMREEGMNGLFITNKNSLLYKEKKLQYKGIIDE